ENRLRRERRGTTRGRLEVENPPRTQRAPRNVPTSVPVGALPGTEVDTDDTSLATYVRRWPARSGVDLRAAASRRRVHLHPVPQPAGVELPSSAARPDVGRDPDRDGRARRHAGPGREQQDPG